MNSPLDSERGEAKGMSNPYVKKIKLIYMGKMSGRLMKYHRNVRKQKLVKIHF